MGRRGGEAGVPEEMPGQGKRQLKFHHSRIAVEEKPPGVTQEAAVSIRTRQPPIERHDFLIAADEHPVE